MYYVQKQYNNGIIRKTRMQCEVIEAKGNWLTIRITSHIVKGVANCILRVKKGNVIGYIDHMIESEIKQYKD